VPFRGDIAMKQPGARRRAPVPPDAAVAADGLRRPPGLGRSLDPAPRVRTHQVGGYTVIELHGEIDIVGLERVGPCLDAATAALAPAVIIDLRPAAFFDCSGLGLLCRAHRRVAERGGRLRLVCDNTLILRTLGATKLLGVLHPVPTLEDALRDE
jgi:anti-sigma B factor antagonist